MVRGRDAGCPAPPAQIRTCALTHTAPTSGSDRGPLDRRIRSVAWYTELRHCVRSVLRPREFPLVTGPWLRQLQSGSHRLVRRFLSYYARVRLLRAVHHRLTASRLPDAVPAVTGTTRRPPRSRHMTYARAVSSSTPWSPIRSHHTDPPGVVFDLQQGLDSPNVILCDAP